MFILPYVFHVFNPLRVITDLAMQSFHATQAVHDSLEENCH